MTIRRGGNPRDDGEFASGRSTMAHRPGEAVPDPGPSRAPRLSARRAGGRSSPERARGGGAGTGGGLLRFGVFLLVLAGLVLVVLFTVGRPLVSGVVAGMAGENPSALGIGFVADMVREDLGPVLTQPAGSDATDVTFVVQPGDTAASIADRLVVAGVLRDAQAFVLVSVERNVTTSYQAGSFVVRQTMTPDQLATALLTPPPPPVPHLTLSIRTGLRLEQIAALIQAKPADRGIAGLTMSAQAFLDLVRNPPASLLKDYPWLKIPKGGTLEGYLAAGDYQLLPDASPEDLVRMMLDQFIATVGPERLKVPASRGLTWTQVLTMASIVEQEARLDSEKPKIAGVLQNRIDPHTEAAGFLGSDPTVLYVNDTLQLAKLPIAKWVSYVFLGPPAGPASGEHSGGHQRLQHVHDQGPAARADLHADRGIHRCRVEPGHAGRLSLLPGQEGRHDSLREDVCGAPRQHREVRKLSACGVRIRQISRLRRPRSGAGPGTRQTGPPDPPGSRACGRSSRPAGSTPTWACAARRSATWRA